MREPDSSVSITGNPVTDADRLTESIENIFGQCDTELDGGIKWHGWSVLSIIQGLMKGPEFVQVLFEKTTSGEPMIVLAVPSDPSAMIEGSSKPVSMTPICVLPTAGVMSMMSGEEYRAPGETPPTHEHTSTTLVRAQQGLAIQLDCALEPPEVTGKLPSPYTAALYGRMTARLQGELPEQTDKPEPFDSDEWEGRLNLAASRSKSLVDRTREALDRIEDLLKENEEDDDEDAQKAKTP